jgi:2-keto-4-pentenoate hydratase/2-oxohepta-3-ene-1,7-dioic acid hydratase in catechol pathway
MARLVVRYREEGAVRWGYVEGDPPTHATDAVEIRPIDTHAATTADLIAALDAVPPAVTTGPSVRIMAKRLLSPVTTDATIFGQAFNYANSAEEAATARPSHMLFTRASSALAGPYDDIVRPFEVELLDYEAEIGIVLRRDLGEPTEIGAANVGDYVAAVVLCNDVSPRDVMFGATFLQWYQGKSYRTFCPAGPVLYLLDRGEVAAVLDNLEIRLWLNGELRQSAHSTQMILGPAQTLSFISRHIDMKRGDLLITGTPAGVVQVISPRAIEIMQTHLMDDERRRDELRKELGNGRRFMEPGDIVSLTLRDTRSGKDLGGHESRIAAARS